ncbi:MAG: ABC transporter ATP-binding protein [Myxococcales bacterium]
MTPRQSAVALRAVSKTFDDDLVETIAPLDLEIEAGHFVALVGPSGCGKTTLLRMIAGLELPSAGRLQVPDRTRMAYVFQDAHLLPWRTVADNVGLPLELRGEPRAARRQAVREALESVELSDFVDSYPSALSGGMRMRASIARALVTRPRLLLMDEPFAALDELTRQRLDERLLALYHEQRFTVVFVTHGIVEATFLADRAIVFSRRPARVVHDATVELPEERSSELRGEPAFAREAKRLLDALERGAS